MTKFQEPRGNELVAPTGYEFTGEFRQGFEGEHVLGRDGQVWDGPELEARLILRKIEEPKSVQKSFLFKYIGYVSPKKGQYFDTYPKGDKFEKAREDFVGLYDTYEKIDI